jgi:glycopeptide antibiotics resistance protein
MNRLVLAIYCVALLMLLLFPFAGPGFSLLGIESDKWMHFALFGGLAVLLRWNLSENRHAVFVAVGAAFVVAAATEVAQGLLAYRSAEFMDLVAGLLGTMFGATSTDRILSSTVLQRLVGLIVAVLGLMVGTFFLLADMIGVGDSGQFGPVQIAGLALGVLIAAGGVGVHVKGIRGVSRLS